MTTETNAARNGAISGLLKCEELDDKKDDSWEDRGVLCVSFRNLIIVLILYKLDLTCGAGMGPFTYYVNTERRGSFPNDSATVNSGFRLSNAENLLRRAGREGVQNMTNFDNVI